jgi:hypothetical protein
VRKGHLGGLEPKGVPKTTREPTKTEPPPPRIFDFLFYGSVLKIGGSPFGITPGNKKLAA